MISLQDTEGKYSGYSLEPSFKKNIDGSYPYWCMNVYHNGRENRDIFLVCQELEQQVKAEGRTAAVGVEYIRVQESHTTDLFPLLKQYGKTEKGVTPPRPDERYQDSPAVPEDVKILDYQQPLDVRLFGNIYLTGIGWIDDQLHIQFHNRGSEYIEMRNGRGTACTEWVDSGRSWKYGGSGASGGQPQRRRLEEKA